MALSRRNRRNSASKAGTIELLEQRRLLSVINWTNRGVTTGANDDRFDDVFGTLQNQARGVVDAAINFWTRTIGSFNYGNGTDTYSITISMNATAQGTGPGGVGANAGFTATINNKPSVGNMGIGWRSGITAGTNSAAGWFLDPTPMESSEFQGAFQNAFVRLPTGNLGGADLFTAVLHELGHAMGLASSTQTRAVSFDTNSPDNQNAPATTPGSTLWAYNSNGSLWTEYDSGGAGGTPANMAGPQHFAPLNTSAVVFGSTRVGAVALMNAFFTSRSIISDVEADSARLAYNYNINTPSQFGTTYNQLDADGTLRINTTSLVGSNDVIDIRPIGGNLQVIVNPSVRVGTIDPLGAITSNFTASQVQRIQIDVGDGNDFVRIFSNGNIPVTVAGGAGTDTLEGHGAPGAYDNFVTTSSSFTATGLSIPSRSSFEQLRIWTEGGGADISLTATGSATSAEVIGDSSSETVNLRTLDTLTPMVMFMAGGNDTVNVQVDPGAGLLRSPVTINGGDGDDIVNIGPVDFASTIVTQPITFNGDNQNDTLVIGSNNADSLAANVTFNGGSNIGGLNDRIIFNDTAPAYSLSYDIRPTFITRVGLSTYNVNYSQAEDITINCGSGADHVVVRNGVSPIIRAFGNDGPDNFTRGDGMITASSGAIFNGGNGIDQITFDDHLNPGNIIFDCRPNEVIYGGIIIQDTTGFESVGVLAGTGQNEITFVGNLFQQFNVDAGPGNDTIIIGFNGRAQFFAPATINGGEGNDNYTWQNNSNNWITLLGGVSTYPVSLDGGGGFNTLSMTEPNRINVSYDLYADRIYSREPLPFPEGADYTYDNLNSITISASPGVNTLNVYGTSSDIPAGNQVSVLMNANNDTINLYPRDAQGNLTINGNLGINGGTEVDTLFVRGEGAADGLNLSFSNPFGPGTQNIFGMGIAGFGTASVEQLNLNGTEGDDTFNINQFTSGAGLAIAGRGGQDVVNYGNNGLGQVTNMASFSFNGQDGYDTFNLNNQTHSGTWTYTRNLGSVSASSTLGAFYFLNESNIELMRINGGPSAETFNINSSTQGGIILDAGGGADVVRLGIASNNVESIQGAVNFVAGADGGRVEVHDTADTTGDTFHLDQQFLGGTVGDNLFGPGGFLSFNGLTDIGGSPAMLINLGSGSDTAFAQPLASGTTTINFGAQNFGDGETLVGDQLNLALATAANYVINGTTNGFVTSSTSGRLNWNGVELPVQVDDTAPSVLAGDFLIDAPAMTVSHVISEAISPAVNLGFLTILNLTTDQPVPYANMATSYDSGTNTLSITFPGYPNGVLPDGNYRITTAAGYAVDLFGNAMADPFEFETFAFAGDANRDRSVDISDFAVLASNFNSGTVFSQGDFDYSGLTDIGDFAILAARFNTMLPVALSRPARTAGSVVFSGRIIDEIGARDLLVGVV